MTTFEPGQRVRVQHGVFGIKHLGGATGTVIPKRSFDRVTTAVHVAIDGLAHSVYLLPSELEQIEPCDAVTTYRCPTCGATPSQACRTASGRDTETHKIRMSLAIRAAEARDYTTTQDKASTKPALRGADQLALF